MIINDQDPLSQTDPIAASVSAVHVAAVEQWLAGSLRPGHADQRGNREGQEDAGCG
ncbi:hypothetical protein [Streptomyces sp. NPDC059224]|uniref:hypothetical protein n=1 Tax=Streptomyces sp. NPDC059224 TaxID=3346775 RepID=UPI0036C0939F